MCSLGASDIFWLMLEEKWAWPYAVVVQQAIKTYRKFCLSFYSGLIGINVHILMYEEDFMFLNLNLLLT